jgi:hypothetical protein
MASTAIQTFSNSQLQPAIRGDQAVQMAVLLAASANYPAGQVLAEVAGTPGTYTKYQAAAVLAAPTVAPTVTDGAAGGFAAGNYEVAYTYLNAQGETTISPVTVFTAAGTDKLHVAALVLPGGATGGMNVYACAAGGQLEKIGHSADGSAADYNVATGVAVLAPSVNTATTIINGSTTAKCLLAVACTTDGSGNITLSTTAGQVGGDFGQTQPTAPAYFRGMFNTADLTGLDAAAAAQLGRLWLGDTTTGLLSLT